MTKIAVTYDNGEVFGHFGRTEAFKVYEVADGEIKSSEVITSNGAGHSALAGVLADNKIDVLICGGIGGGAEAALMEEGIVIYSGVSGNADEAVASFLRGELTRGGANCDHHGEGHECDSHEGCHCGGGCGGGCHAHSDITGKNVGKRCKTHYKGTFNDGTQFDSSYDRGEPLEFICGAGMMIKGFDKAVANMEVGEIVEVHLTPDEAYGQADSRNILTLPIAELPGSEELSVGESVYLTNQFGHPIPVTVTAKDDVMITLDANHEMAGKELNFTIELVEVGE